MSSTRTIWSFIDEILRERGPWRFYAVHIGRSMVLSFGIELEVAIHLNEAGTGRRLSVSFLGADPPTMGDLSRAGYAVERVGRHTFASRPLANDREVHAEMDRWETIARSGSLRHLPTRKQRQLTKQSIAFPTSAIAAARGFDDWRTAFVGLHIRGSGAVVGRPSLELQAFATASIAPSEPTAFSAGMNLNRHRRPDTKAVRKKMAKQMRVLLVDPKYRHLGADDPRIADACFFEKKLRSFGELRRERKRLAAVLGENRKR